MARGVMIFTKKLVHFILLHLIFSCYHYYIDHKRQSEHSRLRPDSSNLVVFCFLTESRIGLSFVLTTPQIFLDKKILSNPALTFTPAKFITRTMKIN